jgi:peptide/nickel transport system ATP-binding protein
VIVEFEHVTKEFHGSGTTVRALEDVSLRFDAGQVVAVVGESGSGKTTLARLLVGLDQATEGRVTIDGRAVTKPKHVAGRVQMVFQDPFASFNRRHTVGYSLATALRIQLGCSKRAASEHSERALEEVGLYPGTEFMRRMPGELSGGQRQRASIARALGGGAELIVADEPTSMLDVSVASQMLKLFEGLTVQGVSYLFITHNLAVARYIADRIVVLYRGTIVEDGPVEEVVQDPRHPYTQLLVQATPDPDRAHPHPIQRAQLDPDRITEPGWCVFAPRCPHRSDACRAPVALVERSGRQTRCVLENADA